MSNYGILLVVSEPSHRAIVSAVLTAGGENVEGVDSLAAALEAVRSRRYDLVLMGIDPAEGDQLVSALRSLSGWSRTVPIIAFAEDGEAHSVAGVDMTLSKPLRAAELTSALRRWLGDDRMAAPPDQQGEKLAALLGADPAAAMVGRFHANLSEAVDEIEAGGDARAIGHRLGGIAGMLGFDVMRTAWLGLEEHGMAAWPTVRALTLEAIARHQAASPSPGA
jgi:two-component system, OmpR family, response regulator